MRYTTITTAAGLAAALLLTGCGSSGGTTSPSVPTTPAKVTTAAKPLTAATAFQTIAAAVPPVKLTGTVTADNDPNHLLGRPNQYTSKITFSDSRVPTSDTSGDDKGDVDFGGAIEVFPNASDAQARATYIQTVTKSMPAAAEYDYIHGTVLVRVSHYLTPAQAADYKRAAAKLT